MKRLATVVILGASLTGCSSSSPESNVVVLDEYSIDVPGSAFAAGRITLAIENAGEFSHTLVVTRATGSAVAATDTLAPGATAELDFDLEPGSYQVSCRIVVQLADGTIVDHYEQGMVGSISVEASG